jgi:hypothetical protein
MEGTWKPVVGGTLNIISGVADILISILYLTIMMVSGTVDQFYTDPGENTIFIIFIVAFFILIGAGIVAIIGGIKALNRNSWRMALAGAILSGILFTWFLGIPSIIFIALSRKEFH